MNRFEKRLDSVFACAMCGLLMAYLLAVLVFEPATYDRSIAAWQWFLASYGRALAVGLVVGTAVGLAVIRFAPADLRDRA